MTDLYDFQMGEMGFYPTTALANLKPLIDACNFTYVNDLIPKLFPLEEQRGHMSIISFPGYITTDEVLKKFDEMGVLPMNATELFLTCKSVNAGEISQRLAGVKVQHGRKQEGPRYRGPSCLLLFIPEGLRPTAVLTGLGVTGAWSERA